MRDRFVYDGVPSTDFNVGISGAGTYTGAKRRTTSVEIPGRSGNVTFDDGAFDNVKHEYKAFIAHTFRTDFDNFRAFLMAHSDKYYRLEDSYHPDEFYLARYDGDMKPTPKVRLRNGEFTLTFDRKPQRFLKLGELTNTYSSVPGGETKIFNPTQFTAYPWLRVYGIGPLTIAGTVLTIGSHNYPYIDIDCERRQAYYNTNNCNMLITRTVGDYFYLPPGTSTINTSQMTLDSQTQFPRVTIMPRWYTI